MTEPLIPPERDISKAVRFFKQLVEVSGTIQQDMSRVLLTDKTNQQELSKQLQGSENDMEIRMDKAVHAFIAVMPLACMNRVNLFAKTMCLHGNLTGDPGIHDIFDEVNRQIHDETDND